MMIKKIIAVKNVGILKNAVNFAVGLEKVNLFFAENGRGKSTIVSIISSYSSKNNELLVKRKNKESDEDIHINFLLSDGDGKSNNAIFQKNSWDSFDKIKFEVFGSDFIERNVYSGQIVKPDQRQSLLSFVLGSESVEVKKEIEQIAKDIEKINKDIAVYEGCITKKARSIGIVNFLNLSFEEDVFEKIKIIEDKVSDIKNIKKIFERRFPVELDLLYFNLEGFSAFTMRGVDYINKQADSLVEDHLKKYSSKNIEAWIRSGVSYIIDDSCPFCGSDVNSNLLLDAYKTAFNNVNVRHFNNIKKMKPRLEAVFSSDFINNIRLKVDGNIDKAQVWSDFSFPTIDIGEIERVFDLLRNDLFEIADRKESNPFVAFFNEKHESMALLMASINNLITDYNLAIQDVLNKIEVYKASLVVESEDEIKLIKEVDRLKLVAIRFDEETKKDIEMYCSFKDKKKNAEIQKSIKRKELSNIMSNVLSKYQSIINQILKDFGANFEISDMDASYSAGMPKTEYFLKINDIQSSLISKDGKDSDFSTLLSEGDKRSLALAFFVAKIKLNKECFEKTVIVFDDPVSSFDSSRRNKTINLIVEFYDFCEQVLVFSHDAYFIKNIKDKFAKRKESKTVVLSLERCQKGYSFFSPIDIDFHCRSNYYKNYRILKDFVDGCSDMDGFNIAKSARLTLEGFYKRTYPTIIDDGDLFAGIFSKIEGCDERSPLSNLKKDLGDLRELVDFFNSFHHNNELVISDSELRAYAVRALSFVHR